MKNLIAPDLPENIDFETIKKTLTTHFDRSKNKFVESIKFHRITKHKGETMASFLLHQKQGAVYLVARS